MGTSAPFLDVFLNTGVSFGVAALKFQQALLDMQQAFAKALILDMPASHMINVDDIDPPEKESK